MFSLHNFQIFIYKLNDQKLTALEFYENTPIFSVIKLLNDKTLKTEVKVILVDKYYYSSTGYFNDVILCRVLVVFIKFINTSLKVKYQFHPQIAIIILTSVISISFLVFIFKKFL